jgi:preprotein translocase subunit SecE
MAVKPGARPAPKAKTRPERRPPGALARRLRLRLSLRFVQEVVAELKKVTWPSRDEVVRLTLVVIVVSVAVGALLGTIDLIFAWLMERLLLP